MWAPVPRASLARRGHTVPPPLPTEGFGGHQQCPPTATGTPPIPAAAAAGAGGLSPPRVSVPRPVQMAEPGSSCPHGGDGANVTPATWHRALALSLSCLLPWVPPFRAAPPGGAAGSTPRAAEVPRGRGNTSTGGVPAWVTGMGGSPAWRGGTQHPPFTLALPRPRRRLKCPPGPPAPVTGSAYSCRL